MLKYFQETRQIEGGKTVIVGVVRAFVCTTRLPPSFLRKTTRQIGGAAEQIVGLAVVLLACTTRVLRIARHVLCSDWELAKITLLRFHTYTHPHTPLCLPSGVVGLVDFLRWCTFYVVSSSD